MPLPFPVGGEPHGDVLGGERIDDVTCCGSRQGPCCSWPSGVIELHLRQARISREELHGQLRSAGMRRLAQVHAVVLRRQAMSAS